MLIFEQDPKLFRIADYVRDALVTDGEHHKQWYLYQIASLLFSDIELSEYYQGIPP